MHYSKGWCLCVIITERIIYTDISISRIHQSRTHNIHHSTRTRNSNHLLRIDLSLEDCRSQEFGHGFLEINTTIVRGGIPMHQSISYPVHVIMHMQFTEFLNVRFHVLPAEDILGYSQQMRTFRMSAISGIEHTLACVHTTEIGFLGCKNLLGTIRSFALKGYPTLRKTAWKMANMFLYFELSLSYSHKKA